MVHNICWVELRIRPIFDKYKLKVPQMLLTKPKFIQFLMLAFFLFASTLSYTQTTIWIEDFSSYANGVQSGAGTGTSTATWSTNDGDVDIQTSSGNKVLRGQDTDNTGAYWTTNPITITGYSNVTFSLDANSGGGLDSGTDVFRIQYRINGGSYVEIENASGDTSPSDPIQTSYSISGLSGNTIDFRITMYNTGGTEFYEIDNFLVVGTAVSCNTILSSPGSTISDFVTLNSTLSGFSSGTITDVNVTLNITHTYDADLNISLTSPGGTTVLLSDDNGGGGNDYTNTIFDDVSGTTITAGSAPFTGTFSPEGNLSDFLGENPNGNWTLSIYDDAGGDQGTLNSFSIEVCTALPTSPVIDVNNVSVNEDAGTMTFTANHVGLAASGPYSVTYNTVDGSATDGNDYTGITGGTLNFDGTLGDSEQIIISITDDLTFSEGDETFTIQFTATTDASVDITTTATGTIIDNEVIPFNDPLTLFSEFNGYYDYAVTGGSLRTSDTNVCTITTTSSNTLTSTVPATAVVERAYLFWTHSGATPDTNVTFEGQNIPAFAVNRSNFGGDIFSMMGDVTTLVSGISNLTTNTFDFSGLTVDNGNPYCSSTVVVGGWSLMIFYTDDSLPAVSINLYQGFDGQQNNTTNYTLDGFFAIGASGAKTTVLSWEGDIGLANNELLSVTTSSGTTTLSGDGNNNGITINNPFNSTLYDNTGGTTVNTTTFGLDLDTYDISALISPGESTATTNVGVGQDFVMLNAVLLKVPSNLIVGNVFDDLNYGGGVGRDLATSGGAGIEDARVELYDNANVFQETIQTDATGEYSFGGMANGSYSIRVVNNTVNSTRGGGTSCSGCMPVQTFRRNYANGTGFSNVTDEVGGADPSGEDVGSGTLTNAQTLSSVNIISEGVVGLDFGFNFNTIVNTNEDGQGSLEQFIVNSNGLDETGLDIEANSIFNPAAGEDTSIFMIPPTTDALGRTADASFASGYFDISISNGSQLTIITGANTKIDGRTQTAYSGDTNAGTVGSGGTTVGTSVNTLPDYERPEIQVHRGTGDVIRTQGDLFELRNISVYADNNASVRVDGGSATLVGNLLGVNATGIASGNVNYGIEMTSGTSRIEGNYIAQNTDYGIYINGGTSTLVQDNHITDNGSRGACYDNIQLNNGTGINIRRNLIDRASSLGIDGDGVSGGITISENTITGSGQDGGSCSGNIENAGILLDGSNSSISNNIIASNGGSGIVLAGGNTSGNLISQNSIYANGTTADALGIDLDISDVIGDGVTLNDTGDSDNGPNGAINFPIIATAYKSGSNIVVSGWSRPGATIEFFLTDVNQGTATLGDNQLGLSADYGEGQVFLTSVVEGSGSDSDSGTSLYLDDDSNTDNTNRFTFTFAVAPGVLLGDDLTATATIANSTSEFSPFSKLKAFTIITNRRITYRVNQ